MGESSAASKDPFHFPAKSAASGTQPESFNVGLTELAQLARQAFEEKRRKQSLALANAILKIDPEDKQAVVIRSWIEADLQNDLKTASALAEEARTKNNPAYYDRAEVSLRTILNIDAENEPARQLLNEITSVQSTLDKTTPAEVEVGAPTESMIALPIPDKKSRGRRWAMLIAPTLVVILVVFVMRNRYELSASEERDVQNQNTAPASTGAETNPATAAGSLEIFVLPPNGVQLSVDDAAAQPAPRTMDLRAGDHSFVFTAAGYAPQTVKKTITPGQHYVLPIVMERTPDAVTVSQPAPTPPKSTPPSAAKTLPNPRPERPPERPSAAAKADAPKPAVPEPPKTSTPLGSLAINAAVPVDVYIAGNHLGVTPLTLQLQAGTQTLEYRYQGLQKTVSHVLKPGETTAVTIAFDVTLQINARPWAQVSIEGNPPRDLGQTPLSNVTAPVGSVLVFQNPSFPEKKYRVTGRDSTVQIVFP